MATRSKVAIVLAYVEDDPLGINPMERLQYRASYVHWDGYPDERYPMLRRHYNSEELARALVELGDMSSIGCTLTDCNVYGKEDSSGPLDYTSFTELVAGTRDSMGEYLYLWQGGKWNVFSVAGSANAQDYTAKCEMTWNNTEE